MEYLDLCRMREVGYTSTKLHFANSWVCKPLKYTHFSVYVRDAFRISTWSLSRWLCFQVRNMAFAVLLLAVIKQRSITVRALPCVSWFVSAGFGQAQVVFPLVFVTCCLCGAWCSDLSTGFKFGSGLSAGVLDICSPCIVLVSTRRSVYSFTERSCLTSLSVSLLSTWVLFCYLCHVLVSIFSRLPSRYLIIDSFTPAVFLIAFPYLVSLCFLFWARLSHVCACLCLLSPSALCPVYVLFSVFMLLWLFPLWGGFICVFGLFCDL